MEEIVKAIDDIHGDLVIAMAQIEVVIEATAGGNVNNGDVSCALRVFEEYVEKRIDLLENIARHRYQTKENKGYESATRI